MMSSQQNQIIEDLASTQSQESLKEFVNQLKTLKILENPNTFGKLMVVDDQKFTLDIMKMQFKQLKLVDRLYTF